MKSATPLFASFTLSLALAACGSGSKDHTDDRSEDGGGIIAPGGGGSPGPGGRPAEQEVNDNAIVRGRWTYQVSNVDAAAQGAGSALLLASKGSVNQPITGMVAAAVTYTVDNANFRAGQIQDGPVSYGSLDITALRDNALRVCGAQGNQKCTKGTLRLYTTGTTRSGLYSASEDVGLPIKTGATDVGLGSANAAVVATVAIGNRAVLKLSDFTTAAKVSVPVSVDFTDSAASTYSSTLVLEYIVE